MTAAGGFEPSGRRWAFSAIRPSVSTAPTTRKYFKINIIAPRAANAAASYLVAPPICGVHLQPYGDTGMAYFAAYGRKLAGAAFFTRARAGAAPGHPGPGNLANKTRPKILPAGPR